MRPRPPLRFWPLVATGALAAALLAASAQAYDPITWYTFDGGGVIGSTGGAYGLSGTVGQPDAGSHSGANFTLSGGFWYGGVGGPVGVTPGEAPRFAFRFHPASPNPTRLHSRLTFELPNAAEARIRVYDVAGRRIQSLALGRLQAGPHDYNWSPVGDGGRPLPNGVYIMRLEAGASRGVQKVLVLR